MVDASELEKLLNDCTLEIDQLHEANNNLAQQNQQLHEMLDEKSCSLQELRVKYDEAVRVRIDLETEKMQIQNVNDEMKSTIEALE